MSSYFFKPRIGSNYEQGFHGAKTLILGAHFYCSYNDCEFYQVCTEQIDIREMDTQCPVYKGRDATYYSLSNSCEIEIESYLEGFSYYAYHLITMYLLKVTDYISEEQKRDFWEKVAFYNFNQHYLPNGFSPSYEENMTLYESDYPAFEALLQELQPDCIFVWSEPVKKCLLAHKRVNYLGKVNIQTLTVHLFSYHPNYQRLAGMLDLVTDDLTTDDIRAMLEQLDLNIEIRRYGKSIRIKQNGKNTLESYIKKSYTRKLIVRQGKYLGFANMPNKYKELYYEKLKEVFHIPYGKGKAFEQLFGYKFNGTSKNNQDDENQWAKSINKLRKEFTESN